jgi:hypothetical protein
VIVSGELYVAPIVMPWLILLLIVVMRVSPPSRHPAGSPLSKVDTVHDGWRVRLLMQMPPPSIGMSVANRSHFVTGLTSSVRLSRSIRCPASK